MKRIVSLGLLLVVAFALSGCYTITNDMFVRPLVYGDESLRIQVGKRVVVNYTSRDPRMGAIIYNGCQQSHQRNFARIYIDGGTNGYGSRVTLPSGAPAYEIVLDLGWHNIQTEIFLVYPNGDVVFLERQIEKIHIGPTEDINAPVGHGWKKEINPTQC